MLVLVVTFLAHVAQPSAAQEVCGLEGIAYNNMFKNGFESGSQTNASSQSPRTESAEAAAAQRWNTAKPLAIAPIPDGGTPTISITEPASDGPISGRTFQIRGTVTGPINTGVSVNGIPAFVQNNQFSTPVLTLPEAGNTTFTATARTLDGATATAVQTHSASSPTGVQFIAGKAGEFYSRPVRFALTINPTLTVQQLTVDYNGDGTPEFTGTDPSLAPGSYTYTQPGIYTAIARVTTVQAGLLETRTIHAALDGAELRTRACSVYGALKARLNANNVAAAILVFPADTRPLYEATFNALGANRPQFASRLGTIATGLLTLQTASLTVVTTDEPQPKSYRIRIAQGSDGVWRIEEM